MWISVNLFVIFFFQDRVSLCSSHCCGTCSVNQTGLWIKVIYEARITVHSFVYLKWKGLSRRVQAELTRFLFPLGTPEYLNGVHSFRLQDICSVCPMVGFHPSVRKPSSSSRSSSSHSCRQRTLSWGSHESPPCLWIVHPGTLYYVSFLATHTNTNTVFVFHMFSFS